MKKITSLWYLLVFMLTATTFSLNAQTTTYSGTFPLTMVGFDALLTNPKAAGWMAHSSTAPSNTARTAKCNGDQAEVNMNAGRFLTYRMPSSNSITINCDGTAARGFWITATKVTGGGSVAVTRSETLSGITDSYLVVGSGTGNTVNCTSMTFNIVCNEPVNIKIYSPVSTETGGGITATGSTYISAITINEYVPLSPVISSFVAEGVTATIDDNAGTISAELPYGSSLAAVTPVVTLGGTATSYSPLGAQDFTAGAINYTATDGTNNKVYAVTLTVPATPPAPVITLTSANSTQGVKPGVAIANIVYTISNATGAGITGLPTGLSGLYGSTGTNTGTYTISGTVDAGATPALNTYTLTATAIAGYIGSDITATGKIVVKSPSAKEVCYLVATTTPSANDTKLYPHLNESPDYVVTLRTAASTAPAASVYDAYDLIVLNEIVGGTNAEAVALKAVDKPILSLKAYTYNSGRWGWGTADNGFAANSIVTVKQPSHPVFNGVTLDAGTLSLVDGASGNTVQVSDVTTLVGRSIVVASAPKATSGNMAVAIHDVPAAIRGVVNSKYILIPIADANYHRMNANALKVIDNAIDYLLNGTQFAAPSLDITGATATVGEVTRNGIINAENATIRINMPIGTVLTAVTPVLTLAGNGTTVTPATAKDFSNSEAVPVVYTVSDMISNKTYSVTIVESTTAVDPARSAKFYLDGQIIRNVNAEQLSVLDMSGRLIRSSNEDIMLNELNKGIYIIRGESGLLKVALTR